MENESRPDLGQVAACLNEAAEAAERLEFALLRLDIVIDLSRLRASKRTRR